MRQMIVAEREIRRTALQLTHYHIIIPFATFALLLRYLIETGESRRTKYIVGGLVGASFFVARLCPSAFTWA